MCPEFLRWKKEVRDSEKIQGRKKGVMGFPEGSHMGGIFAISWRRWGLLDLRADVLVSGR